MVFANIDIESFAVDAKGVNETSERKPTVVRTPPFNHQVL